MLTFRVLSPHRPCPPGHPGLRIHSTSFLRTCSPRPAEVYCKPTGFPRPRPWAKSRTPPPGGQHQPSAPCLLPVWLSQEWRINQTGTSLQVQWLRLGAPAAGGLDLISGGGAKQLSSAQLKRKESGPVTAARKALVGEEGCSISGVTPFLHLLPLSGPDIQLESLGGYSFPCRAGCPSCASTCLYRGQLFM